MRKVKAFGLSRSRDSKGKIVSRPVNPYVNCIHTSAGGGYEDMWILILEVYETNNLLARKDMEK